MKLDFCAACGGADNLEQHRLAPIIPNKALAGRCPCCGGDPNNSITLCHECHEKVRERTATNGRRP